MLKAFALVAPPAVTTGVPFQVTVTALDQFGAPFTEYLGTVHFTSSDGSASPPPNTPFIAGDNGVKTFNFTLNSLSNQTITVADRVKVAVSNFTSKVCWEPRGPVIASRSRRKGNGTNIG